MSGDSPNIQFINEDYKLEGKVTDDFSSITFSTILKGDELVDFRSILKRDLKAHFFKILKETDVYFIKISSLEVSHRDTVNLSLI